MNMHILKNSSNQWPIILFLLSLSFALVIDFPVADTPNLFSVRKAEARVGRPVSPHSAAGVHRRTRRRTTRRVAAGTRVHTLPAGCTTVIKRGVNYHSCGGVYYRPYYEGNTVVYVVENP
jgi:hypothetical protein